MTRRAASLSRRAGASHVTAALGQLASLLKASLPLATALDVLHASTDRAAVQHLIAAIRRDVTQGIGLSRALARHPSCFNDQCCALVAVGEASGTLAGMLERIADERRRIGARRARLRAALTYPACLLTFCVAIVAVLTQWVIPAFEDIFASFDAALPASTQTVIDMSHGIASGLPHAIVSLALVWVAHRLIVQRSPRLRTAWSRAVFALPLLGSLLTRHGVARWCRGLGTLLGAGIPLADALDILSSTSGHPLFDHATRDAGTRIRRGERLSSALAHRAIFPASIVSPIAVAEQTGALDMLLIDLADFADRDLEAHIDVMLNLVEPALVAILGLLIGGIVLTLYLPIIELGRVL